MRKILLVIAVCLMGLALAFGQSSQQSPSPAQQPSSSQQQSPMSGDQTVSGNSGTNNQGQANVDRAAPGQPQPARAGNHRGGVPWGFIILGIVVALFVIEVATRNRRGRSEPPEQIDRDDLPRAG